MESKRIPAKGVKCTLHRGLTKDDPFFIRVYGNGCFIDDYEDYDLHHFDLNVIIDDDSAEFVVCKEGRFLDYSKDVLEPSEESITEYVVEGKKELDPEHINSIINNPNSIHAHDV